jgi:peroxiredoxin
MSRRPFRWLIVPCLLFAGAGLARSQVQVKLGEPAPDFPAGAFADGKSYSIDELKGRLVVLYFFDGTSAFSRTAIPERNAVVKAMQGKPVKFFGIMANATLTEAALYQQQLTMPIYVDNFGLMQKRHGLKIDMKNIWQNRLVVDGKLVGIDMSKDALQKAIEKEKVAGKYLGQDYDAKLAPALEALEWGQVAQGLKLLAPSRKSINKELAKSANQLYEDVKKEGEDWKTSAEAAVESDPVKAYDLYTDVATAFTGDELGKSVAAPLKKLAKDKAVVAELAARKAFAQYLSTAGKLPQQQKATAVKMLQDIAKKHPGTPTADRAMDLMKELE